MNYCQCDDELPLCDSCARPKKLEGFVQLIPSSVPYMAETKTADTVRVQPVIAWALDEQGSVVPLVVEEDGHVHRVGWMDQEVRLRPRRPENRPPPRLTSARPSEPTTAGGDAA